MQKWIGRENWEAVRANRPGSQDGTITRSLKLHVLVHQRADALKNFPTAEPCPGETAIVCLDKLPQVCRVESLGERHEYPSAALDDVLLLAQHHRLVIHILDRLVRG